MACGCQLCQPSGEERDGHDEKLLADVRGHGWHVVTIKPEHDVPGWAFSVGLTHSFGAPELAVFGLPARDAHVILNLVGDRAKAGDSLVPGERLGDVLERHDVELRRVDQAWNHALFGYARWFHNGREPQFLQVVWPDGSSRFPWEPGFDETVKRFQPELWMFPPESAVGPWRAWWFETMWRPRAEPSGLVFASMRVVAGEAPVLGVQVFDDGDWAFLDGQSSASEDMAVVHLHHVLEHDPTLEDMAALEPGTIAWRERPGGPWSVSPLDF